MYEIFFLLDDAYFKYSCRIEIGIKECSKTEKDTTKFLPSNLIPLTPPEFNPENIGKDFEFSEIYYIDTSSVTEGKLTDIQRLEKKDAPSRAKRLVKKNDILISTVRPNLKHYYFVKNPQENLVVSTGFVVIRSINVNPLYLYYYLITPSFIEYLSGVADSHTSAYPSFLPEIIEETEIDLPDNSVQEQIGKTLDVCHHKLASQKRTG